MASKRTSAKKSPARRAAKKTKKTASGRARSAPKSTGRSQPKMDAQVEQIQRVIDVMVSAGAVEVELEDGATKLRVRLKDDQPQLALPAASFSAPAMSAMNDVGANVASKTVAGAADAGVGHAGGQPFQSPMVGTFYRSPSPDAEPFAKVGDHVGPDSVICIIEAMKVMNEIRAETEGEVVEVLAQNGEPVDYGQPLFVIRS